MDRAVIREKCEKLLVAYKDGKLGQTVMPEDANPGFGSDQTEERLAYFTLPMALNYQRDSYALWEAARKTYDDPETKFVFDIRDAHTRTEDDVRAALTKHKLALQPNKHVHTWRTIAATVDEQWGSFASFIDASGNDFLRLKQLVQFDHKKGFPYLSGPKIFNYWAFIISTYGTVPLRNRDYIDIAPDTHITQCSVILRVITPEEAVRLSREQISARWRELLTGSGIDPIDMHPPFWFWSRNGFLFEP